MRRLGYSSYRDTPLSRCHHFLSRENRILDYLHDILQGIVHFDLLGLLRFLFSREICTIDYLNKAIQGFEYGPIDDDKRPSATFDLRNIMNENTRALRQHASQVHVLIRVMPFITVPLLEGYIAKPNTSEDEQEIARELIDLQSSMLKIMRLVFCRKMSEDMIDDLEEEVEHHQILYCDLFRTGKLPIQPLINKAHQVLHIALCIRCKGTMPQYACFCFEGYHRLGTDRMKTSRNFVNPPKTISDRIAIKFSYQFSYPKQQENIKVNDWTVEFNEITYKKT